MYGIPLRFIIGAVTLLALVAAVFIHFRHDAKVRADLANERAWGGNVIEAVAEASDNPEVTKDTAVGQIRALGDSNRSLKVAIATQNQAIDDMAREAVRLKARAAELKRIADKAEAQRQGALRKLSDMAITPGTREDCMVLLGEAEAALNIVREAGL